jgi:hypothetical protein
MPIDRQTQALLALVEADRERKCEAILAEARSRADALLAEAHADARRRMRDMFREERERRDERVAAARANLQTRRRLALQRRAAALLAEGWRKLPAELVRRWREPATRAAWVAAVVANARDLLPNAAWTITHAADWPEPERAALARELAAALGAPPAFIADPAVAAGLKVAAQGNVIDSTLAGITADRAAIGGELLRLLEGAPTGESEK